MARLQQHGADPRLEGRGGQDPHAAKHASPRTDDILSRSINLSVGVVDSGIGADFGITILSDENAIDQAAEKFVEAARSAH